LANTHALADVLNLEYGFNEDRLYQNLKWLHKNQAGIEDRLFNFRYRQNQKCELFLYDVTSSYLEGDKNELAEYGYNRDGKKGKKQIVIGLLCGQDGKPVSIEVFTGNTQDPKTLESQIKKATNRFNCKRVTMVGDRGMIKSGQIEKLQNAGFHYITAITKPQIEALIKDSAIQMELFSEDLCEVERGGVRYILRRNPIRMREIELTRREKQSKIEDLIAKQNKYLKEHKKAKIETAIKRVTEKINKLKVNQWISVEQEQKGGRKVIARINEEMLEKISVLDGCYCLKTDLDKDIASSKIIHDRYKDLTLVERAFRTSKTTHLELRPIFVTREESTRAHVLIVMLSYLIIKELEQSWKNLDVTVGEGIEQLKTLCSMELRVKEKGKKIGSCHQIPKPRKDSQGLLKALNIKMPKVLAHRNISVVSRKKLVNRK
jgi:transposase